jgi:hypothetical protein
MMVLDVAFITMGDGGFIQRGGWWVVAQNALTLAALALGPLFRAQWQLAAISTAGGGC